MGHFEAPKGVSKWLASVKMTQKGSFLREMILFGVIFTEAEHFWARKGLFFRGLLGKDPFEGQKWLCLRKMTPKRDILRKMALFRGILRGQVNSWTYLGTFPEKGPKKDPFPGQELTCPRKNVPLRDILRKMSLFMGHFYGGGSIPGL